MRIPLRVLIATESVDDATVFLWALQDSGYESLWERTATAVNTTEALDRQSWDLLIIDYDLPHWHVHELLTVLQNLAFHPPVFLVSSPDREAAAVATLRIGIQDYFRKDRLARLGPAVARELHVSSDCQRQRPFQGRAAPSPAPVSPSSQVPAITNMNALRQAILQDQLELHYQP